MRLPDSSAINPGRYTLPMSRLFVFRLSSLSRPPAHADAIESSDAGLFVRNEAMVAAPPGRVFSTLTDRVGMWWDASHTFSGDPKNLSIEAKAGGCFCERLPNGGSVRHLSVIYVDPDKELRLEGGLGPLQESAVAGVMIWKLMQAGSSTQVTLTYAVGGYRPGGKPVATPVDGVLRDQLARLKRLVETGRLDTVVSVLGVCTRPAQRKRPRVVFRLPGRILPRKQGSDFSVCICVFVCSWPIQRADL